MVLPGDADLVRPTPARPRRLHVRAARHDRRRPRRPQDRGPAHGPAARRAVLVLTVSPVVGPAHLGKREAVAVVARCGDPRRWAGGVADELAAQGRDVDIQGLRGHARLVVPDVVAGEPCGQICLAVGLLIRNPVNGSELILMSRRPAVARDGWRV